MDINSPEFYTIAFVVAVALVVLLMGRVEKGPASTFIAPLDTRPDGDAGDGDLLTLQPLDNGKVKITRTGLMLGPGETVNLVFTIRGEECSIVEKKGVKRRGEPGEPVCGEASVKWLRRGTRYRIRYESQVTSAWATFAFNTADGQARQVQLKL